MTQFYYIKILLFISFAELCFCDLYYTTITSGEVYSFNFTANTSKVVAKNQGALSKITNSKYYLFWMSGKNIMKNTKGFWNDVFIFAKTDTTFDRHISGIHASKTALYWSIGNKIYSQEITGLTPTIFYESPNTSTTITSMVYITDYSILCFVNGSTSLHIIDGITKDYSDLDFSDILKPDCGGIFDIRILGGSFFMITYGGSYGCVFKGSVQDISNLNLIQKTGVSNLNILDIAVNTTIILSLHHNTNCLTSLFYDYPKFCIPDSLGYFGGASFDVIE